MDAVGKCEDLKIFIYKKTEIPDEKENKGEEELGALKDASGVEARILLPVACCPHPTILRGQDRCVSSTMRSTL